MLLRESEVSRMLKCTHQTVTNLSDKGLINCIELPTGRRMYHLSEVENFLSKYYRTRKYKQWRRIPMVCVFTTTEGDLNLQKEIESSGKDMKATLSSKLNIPVSEVFYSVANDYDQALKFAQDKANEVGKVWLMDDNCEFSQVKLKEEK